MRTLKIPCSSFSELPGMWLLSQVLAWSPRFSPDFIICLSVYQLGWSSAYLDDSHLMQFPMISWVNGTPKKFLVSTALTQAKGVNCFSPVNQNNQLGLLFHLFLKVKTIVLHDRRICLSALCVVLFRELNISLKNEHYVFPVSDSFCNSWWILGMEEAAFQVGAYGN